MIQRSTALVAIGPGIGRGTADWLHDVAVRSLAAWRQWRQNLRDRRCLALLGRHECRRLAADIGVTPAELTAALSRPPWRDRRAR